MNVLVATEDRVVAIGDDAQPRVELEGRRVTSLRRRGDDWWAVADGDTIVRRDADGSWSDVATSEHRLTCSLPVPDGAIVGTRDGHLLRLFKDRFARIEGFDEVEGRDTWHAVGSDVPYVRSLTQTSKGTLLANVHVGGIPRSANNGTTWKPTIDPEIDVHEVRAHPSDPQVVIAAAGHGFCESRDAGETWTVSTEGFHASYLRAVTFPTSTVVVSASDGPFGHRGALYRRALEGGPVERCTDGLPEWIDGNVDTGCLDAARSRSASVTAFGAPDGTVFASHDEGRTWSTLATGLGRIAAVGVEA